ncbi:MAG: hypothetical protein A2204_03945 [Elusimicrobia bacterium RIFOXYA1_FULL_47_7]|nr:MAG: hypothetical protein A2278_02855 [Elusimicrobia bacterium RIFOXYA12_FULL_49_49]OGS07182.1 MAG: hypothetical protein A2204_03945 [Elusimicrobia bacterium RIFOXYA1_FULL_47_7]OGS11753.1 MAG: hypothetical protein A2386_02550 [Elusimicrobia bacterium RIFOXYB1_FULL_48_9]OGS16421.1 MAG: hypothetical protein A2251_06310 [Elusimicrobia bacterium RIFOXYA2_FULL_47_53]OGS27204.1 MAG: hypothetical protein A2339_07875 [Elusimicrobia bacterium RIFOXYB12_FULL_50_12]OGS30403.1 MAG: hypothetical protein
MNGLDLLGFAAGLVCTLSFVPQAWRIFKLKSAKDISLVTFIFFCLGVALWAVYGIFIGSLPIIIANTATLALGLAILTMKIQYK